ncbi:MAG: hypothetical protein ABL996_19500 [Micropepsaceae bacterium]
MRTTAVTTSRTTYLVIEFSIGVLLGATPARSLRLAPDDAGLGRAFPMPERFAVDAGRL